ncbi:MAG: hypothetical protein ACI8ZX_000793 [Planctomycetota bacterium]|jgi:hypothetical protein
MTMRHQKRGIGLKLIQTAVDYLLENKMNSMSVWVLKDNPANNFYTKLGGILFSNMQIKIGEQSLTAYCYGWTFLIKLKSSS